MFLEEYNDLECFEIRNSINNFNSLDNESKDYAIKFNIDRKNIEILQEYKKKNGLLPTQKIEKSSGQKLNCIEDWI